MIDRRRALIALLSGVGGCVSPSRFAFGDQRPAPYKRMFDDPLQFTGPDDALPGGEFRIGVFSPGTGPRSLLPGAQRAVDQLNKAAALRAPVRIIQRWADDPWGAGSQEVIKLVYEDRVLALIGGPDSASTHVAQQIALKAHVPLVAPVATDPTLTEIRVPWIFRLPPNDDALAAALLASQKVNASSRVGMLYADLHDARMAAAAFRKTLQTKDAAPVFEFIVPDAPHAIETAVKRAAQFSPDTIWVWFGQERLNQFVKIANEQNVCKQVITQWNAEHAAAPVFKSRMLLHYAAPFELNGQKKDAINISNYRDAYCYDAVQLIAAAVQLGGVTRKRVRDQIAQLSGLEGAAGKYAWDNGGGNIAAPVVQSFSE